MPVIQNTMNWQEVAVPLVKGLDNNTRARLADPATLVEALNVVYPRDGGPEKRKGFTGEFVDPFDAAHFETYDKEYVYGLGYVDNDRNVISGAAGNLRFCTTYNNEQLVCSGSSLFTKVTNKWKKITDSFYINSLETRDLGKESINQSFADMADNGVIKVLVYRDQPNSQLYVKVYDSVTGALKFTEELSSDPEYVQVIPVGKYVHIYCSEIASAELMYYVVKPESYTLNNFSLGECKLNFDVVKVTDTMVLVLKRTNADGIVGGYVNDYGAVNTTTVAFNTALDLGGTTTNHFAVAVDNALNICVLWDAGATQRYRVYTNTFSNVTSVITATSRASCSRVALSFIYNKFAFFVEYTDYVDSGSLTYSSAVTSGTYRARLASKAFAVGGVGFAFLVYVSTYQTTYFLMSYNAVLSGKAELGTAVDTSGDLWLFSVNTIEEYKFHGVLMYRKNIQPGVYHEPSIKEFRLNFNYIPDCVEVGKTLYMSGSQIWEYDGRRIVENNFTFVPETFTITSAAGGSLTSLGTYFYRTYLCWKNEQGEECRSRAIYPASVTLSPGNNSVNIGITDAMITNKPGAYYLIYRNADTGTNWHLVNSRDPNSPGYISNNGGFTYNDTLSDSALISRELDSATTLLQFPAPSCTVMSYGKDRIWISGGEIPYGTVMYSRLFDTTESCSFSYVLEHGIDRNLDPITGIGFLANYCVIFKRNSGYILEGDGLDNNAQGSLFISQKTLSDVGSTSNLIANINSGILFQCSAGYRLLEPGGRVVDIGQPVNDLSSKCTGIFVDKVNTHVVFYQDTVSLVFNYLNGLWSKWSVTPSYGNKYLCVGRRYLTPSDDYTDDGISYIMKIKTAAIGASLGGFQRIRYVAGDGQLNGPCSFTVKLYLDDLPYRADTFSIIKPENSSTYGDGSYGQGFWGDVLGTGQFARVSRLAWRKRPSVQKCSCISVEIEYNGVDKGPVHSFLVFTVGVKNGIDKGAR